MKSLIRHALGLASCFGFVAGCSGSSSDSTPTSSLTYWADIAPVLNDKCVKCHQPGGIGPFSMLDYNEVSTRAALIGTMTKTRQMPPYQIKHDGTCGQFEGSEALTDDQIDKIQQWAAGKISQGSKASLTPPKVTHLDTGTDMQTPAFMPVAAG